MIGKAMGQLGGTFSKDETSTGNFMSAVAITDVEITAITMPGWSGTANIVGKTFAEGSELLGRISSVTHTGTLQLLNSGLAED